MSRIIDFYINIIIFRDNVPTIELATWPLEVTLFDGEGPVPVIFSDEPEATATAIAANPAKAHYDIQKVARCFAMMENIRLDEALAIIKKPR
jgi:hypothetical protein